MASVHVALVRSASLATTQEALPFPLGALDGAAEMITSSGTSQPTTMEFEGNSPSRWLWRIAVTGNENVHVAFGVDPVASATAGFLCPAGGVYLFGVANVGDKVAVINA